MDTQTVQEEVVVRGQLERHVDKDSQLGDCLRWKVTGAYTFRKTSHVNLQQKKAIKVELQKMGRFGKLCHQVQPLLCDSQVCCAVLSKGQSSSYKLNRVMRAMLPTMLALDVSFAANWIGTKHNQQIMDTSVFTGWEIFAGSARLTKARIPNRACRMRGPVDLLYQRDAFDRSIDQAIRRGGVNCCPPG